MKKRVGILAVLWLVFCAWTLWGWHATRSIAAMAYTVQERSSVFEVRRYEPYVMAQVPVSEPSDALIERAAQAADAYVRGDNITLSSMAGDGEPVGEPLARYTPTLLLEQRAALFVASILPPALRITTVPRPNDPRIRLVEVPAQTVAVMTLRGSPTPDDLARYRAELVAALAADGRLALSEPRTLRIAIPGSPPFLQRTELHVTLRDSGR